MAPKIALIVILKEHSQPIMIMDLLVIVVHQAIVLALTKLTVHLHQFVLVGIVLHQVAHPIPLAQVVHRQHRAVGEG